MANAILWSGGGCFCILLITSVILFACSFALVEPTEYGLDWDNNWFTIDDTQVYEGGRHFLGLGHTFIIYPKILRTIKMSGDIPTTGDGENDVEVESAEADSESESTGVRPTSVLNARTSDGLQVMLDLSYQYKLMATPEDLTQLWYDYEDQYEAAFVRISRDTLRNVASQFAAFQYFYNRSIISDAMRIALDAELSNHHANVESFQLLNIALPSKFSDVHIFCDALHVPYFFIFVRHLLPFTLSCPHLSPPLVFRSPLGMVWSLFVPPSLGSCMHGF